MGNALVTLILVAVVLVGVLTLASGSISSLDMISNSWKQMEEQMVDKSRTQIACVNATANGAGAQVNIIVSNEGQLSLSDFTHWDVILQYYDGDNDYHAKWLPYSSSAPSSNEWTVNEISFEGAPETIEPGILNPREEMEIIAKLDPAVGGNTTNLATVSAPNGISSQIIFQREGGA